MCYIPLRTPCNYSSKTIYYIDFTIASIFFFVLWFYHFLTFFNYKNFEKCMFSKTNKKLSFDATALYSYSFDRQLHEMSFTMYYNVIPSRMIFFIDSK